MKVFFNPREIDLDTILNLPEIRVDRRRGNRRRGKQRKAFDDDFVATGEYERRRAKDRRRPREDS